MSKKSNASYTQEYRIEAVKLITEKGLTLKEAASSLSMPLPTLVSWVTAEKEGKLGRIDSQRLAKVCDHEAENKRLKGALEQALMERDILKKATAYFAKESLQSTRS